MAFNRSTTANGKIVVNERTYDISFTYTDDKKPVAYQFATNGSEVRITGSFIDGKITNYSVTSGIVPDEEMHMLQKELVNIEKNYTTV